MPLAAYAPVPGRHSHLLHRSPMLLRRVRASGAAGTEGDPCHVSVHPTRPLAFVSNYGSGSFQVGPLHGHGYPSR